MNDDLLHDCVADYLIHNPLPGNSVALERWSRALSQYLGYGPRLGMTIYYAYGDLSIEEPLRERADRITAAISAKIESMSR